MNAADDLLPLAGGSTSVLLILPPTSASTPICDLMRLNSPNSELWNRGGGYDWHFHAIPNGRKNIHFSGHGFIAGTVKEKVSLTSPWCGECNWSARTPASGGRNLERRYRCVPVRLIDLSQRYTVVSYDYKQMYRAVIADNLRPEMMP